MLDKSTPTTRAPTTRGSDAGRSPRRPAAGHGDEVDHLVLDLPVVGTLRLPRPEQVAYYGAVGVLIALDIVEWPIALFLATAGYVLTHSGTTVPSAHAATNPKGPDTHRADPGDDDQARR